MEHLVVGLRYDLTLKFVGCSFIYLFLICSPVDSIREAVLTVSPNRQKRGMVSPTTPAQQGPAGICRHLANQSFFVRDELKVTVSYGKTREGFCL